MKIVFIISHINNSLQWLWFSEELLKQNIPHCFIIINEEPPLIVDELKNTGIAVHYLKHSGSFSHFSNLIKTVRILKRYDATVIQTELPYGNLIGLIAGYLCKIKIRISTASNITWAKDFKSTKQKIIDKITFSLSSKIITQTDLSKDFLIQEYKIPESKIVTIWHALKFDDYENITLERIQLLKKKFNVGKNDFIVGMIARFESWKGHKYAIEAFIKIHSQYPDIKLFIFGHGDLESEFQKLIADNNLSESVIIQGFERDIVALYRIFDIHLHIPVNEMVESFGLTIIEGMISACPQILTRSGIAYSTAENLENCILVDYCNSEEVANAIIMLRNNNDIRKKISNKAKEDALKLFNTKKKVEEHLQLYVNI